MQQEVGRLEPSEWIGRTVEVVMDRPLGSRHPEYGFVYELNYGYVPGTRAPDGEELDAYVVGADQPLDRCVGRVVAVILRADDIEDKVVVSVGGTWTEETITRAVRFQEHAFDHTVVAGRGRPDPHGCGAGGR
jgi:inorganic pyrophosphatase